MFKDVKAESGMKLEECPIGDERQLPAAISRFCRTLKRIYVNNSERMQQFQATLEEQLAASEELCQRFDDIAALAEKAEESRAEWSALETKFEAENEALQKSAGEASGEIKKLESGIEKARTHLDSKKQEGDSIKASIERLRIDISELSDENEILSAETARLQTESDNLRPEREQLIVGESVVKRRISEAACAVAAL